MSDPRDLIDKTDALLGRYRGAPKTAPEIDFPVLTEVYDHRAAPPSAPEVMASASTGNNAMPPAHAAESNAYREDLLVEDVLRRLAPHIDEALGLPLKERLDEHLRRALSALTGQVRIDIETLVRAAVSEAVDRALAERKGQSLPR